MNCAVRCVAWGSSLVRRAGRIRCGSIHMVGASRSGWANGRVPPGSQLADHAMTDGYTAWMDSRCEAVDQLERLSI